MAWYWIVLLVLAALLLLLMIAPYFEAKSLQRCSYYLTNRRAFIVADDRTVHSMDLRYVDQVFVLDGAPIGDSLVLGSAMYRDLKKQVRWLAVHPRPTPGEQGAGMVFYSVRNAKEAKAYLDTLLTTK